MINPQYVLSDNYKPLKIEKLITRDEDIFLASVLITIDRINIECQISDQNMYNNISYSKYK